MDDIGFGIHIVSPIEPENSLINDKEITNIPSAVMLPLPEDSFQRDGNTTEYTNVRSRPDQDRSGTPSRGDFAGKSSPRAAAGDDGEETQTSLLLEEAYTLSLSEENHVPATIKGEHQNWQLSSYDQFGRSTVKQTVQPGSGKAAEKDSFFPQNKLPEEESRAAGKNGEEDPTQKPGRAAPDNEGNGKINSAVGPVAKGRPDSALGKVPADGVNPFDTMLDTEGRTVWKNGVEDLAQAPGRAVPDAAGNGKTESVVRPVSEEQSDSGLGRTSTDGTDPLETIPKTDGGLTAADAASKGGTPETTDAVVSASAEKTGVLQGTRGKDRPDMPPAKVEPNDDVRYLLKIPADADKLPPQAEKEDLQTALSRALGVAEAKGTAVEDESPAVISQTGLEQKTLGNLQEAGLGALAAALPSAKGGMVDLEKIRELPYSLYLFGEIPPKLHEKAEKSGEPFVIHSGEKRGAFSQSDFLRLCDAIKMTCVLHDLYWGGSGSFEQETPWYGPYIRYAVKNKIMKAEEFPNYHEFATRAETAYLFSNSIPRSELRPINRIVSLPDVDVGHKYADGIYLLYNAGVLTGIDGRGSFHPEGLITRREAAAFAGRIATPSDRKYFQLS